MFLFKKECKHKWEFNQESNALQFDDMGYPLRLFIMKCSKCGAYDQQWIDVPAEEADELHNGKSVLVKWR